METVSDRRLIVHHLLRAFILGGIAFYIVRLQNAGSLTLYIAPRMSVYVKLAAIVLYVVAVVQVYQAYRLLNRQEESCGCAHPPSRSAAVNIFVYSLFIIPLALGFLSPDSTIGSAMAAQKGITLSTSESIKQKESRAQADNKAASQTAGVAGKTAAADPNKAVSASHAAVTEEEKLKQMFPADEFTQAYSKYGIQLYKQPLVKVENKDYMETLTAVDLYLDNFVGKKLSIDGFVYRDDTMKESQFILGRFAVQCCTADAIPYGVLIDSPETKLYKDDTWLNITGTLSKTEYNGEQVMLLKAEKITKIKPAKDPYVYPDYNFG